MSAKPITLLAKDGANIYSTGHSMTGVGPLQFLLSPQKSLVAQGWKYLFYADPTPLHFFLASFIKLRNGLSPISHLKDWGAGCPHQPCGAFKLQYDMSWTPIDDVAKKDAEIAIMDKILSQQTALPPCLEPNFENISK